MALLAERRAYLEAHAGELDASRQAPGGRQRLRPAREVTTGAGMVEVSAPAGRRPPGGRAVQLGDLAGLHAQVAQGDRGAADPVPARACRPATSPPRWASSSAPTAGLSASTRQPAHRGLAGRARRVDRAGPFRRRLRLLVGRRRALQHPPRRGPPVLPGHRGRAPRRHQGAGGAGRRLPRVHRQSWAEVLRSLQDRGLSAPVLAVGDGALGFWGALRDVFPETREQRCWVH